MEYIELNNWIKMPMLGLETYLVTPDEAENSVEVALKNGYKLIDTANAYVNEKAVGRGIKKSGIDRSEIFLETKLWPSFYEDDDAIEKAHKEWKLKSIGISNLNKNEPFYVRTDEALKRFASWVPDVENQK